MQKGKKSKRGALGVNIGVSLEREKYHFESGGGGGVIVLFCDDIKEREQWRRRHFRCDFSAALEHMIKLDKPAFSLDVTSP